MGDTPHAVADRPNSNAPVKGKQWAVITGLVPIEAQVKEYRAAFRDARKTDPNLDYPRYDSFEVERAEVPVGTAGEDKGKELDWKLLDRKRAENEEASFAERAIDVIDQVFSDQVLTRPLFKISGKAHDRSVGHPKIPTGSQAPGSVAPAAPVARGGGLRGAAMNAGGGLRGAAMRGGGAAANVNVNTSNSQAKAVEHLLFRCFDFTVTPGKTYRYRVRLVLSNPNYGLGANIWPIPSSPRGRRGRAHGARPRRKLPCRWASACWPVVSSRRARSTNTSWKWS